MRRAGFEALYKDWCGGKTKRLAEDKTKFPIMFLPYHVRLKILDLAIDPVKISVSRETRKFRSAFSICPLARTRSDRLYLETLMVTIEKKYV